jgi:4-amino-4-deoxy-L-arabinose transferase-like glycosyltransferase
MKYAVTLIIGAIILAVVPLGGNGAFDSVAWRYVVGIIALIVVVCTWAQMDWKRESRKSRETSVTP